MLLLLVIGLATVVLAFPFMGFSRRDRVIAAWSEGLLRVCGVSVQSIDPPAPEPAAEPRSSDGSDPGATVGTLLVCNHVSWLDIFVILARRPAHFVAKSEIATWPLAGRLVRGAGTLFIERGRRHAVHQLNERIGSMLNAGRCVAVFPEGTTSDGRRLLPFHANLIEPALRCGAPVVPIGLRYLRPDGAPHEAIDFTGDTSLVASMLRVFGSARVVVQVHALPAVSGPSRHAVAQAARRAMAERLDLPTEDNTGPLHRAIEGGARPQA
jgi:1-acyl-sn-glycerol-3-phosphate acyltransferase